MNAIIKIGKPYLSESTDSIRLNAKISMMNFPWGSDEKVLWIEAEKEYGKYFTTDRADAFLLGFIHYALRYGAEIVSDSPISVRLYEQIVNQFVPWYLSSFRVTKEKHFPKPIKITAPTIEELEEKGTAVGAGVSCGVDSMHVFATKSDITHGLVWNMFPNNYRVSQERRDKAWIDLKSRSQAFMNEIGKPLITLDTNYDTALFPEMWSDYQFTWANLFAIRSLQKLLGKYYFASGNPIWTVQMDIHPWRCCCSYEPILLPLLSASGTLIQLVGEELYRREKIKIIADYPPACKHLFVCRGHEKGNCTSRCEKCIETLLQMESVGVVDKFAAAFDLDEFYRNHDEYLVFYLRHVNKYTATDFLDLKGLLKIPLRVRFKAFGRRIRKHLKFGV